MKKLGIIVLTIGMLFTFAACAPKTTTGGTAEASPSDAQETKTPKPQTAESQPPEDTALSGKVQLSGSTSMETIANALKEAFTSKNGEISVDVQLGGSSVGIKDVQEGKSDIGNVSRELKPEETGVVAHKIAIDGIAVIVNPQNKVTDISKEDLIKIYKGEIRNWSEVGGENQPIVVIGREASSGTRGAFEELLKIEDQAKYAQELTETGAVKTAVSTTPMAIGYVSLEALDDTVVALNLDGAAPSEEQIKAGAYALSRPFLMVTKQGDVRPEVQAFLDFVLGAEGQAVVADNHLIPIT